MPPPKWVFIPELGTAPGDALEDTLRQIETVRGCSFGDTLVGDEIRNSLNGGDGNRTLKDAEGRDVIDGGFGADYYGKRYRVPLHRC